jgi:cyclopropane-fatty-acyl-phospholipid synthase
MAKLATKTADQAAQVTLSLLQDVLSSAPASNIAVRLWDGTTWKPDPAEPTRCTLVLQHPGALRKMFIPPNEMSLGEAYLFNDFDIEGDIEVIVPLMKYFLEERKGKLEMVRDGARLLSLPKMGQPRPSETTAVKLHGLLHSRERDRQAIQHHYDRSNEFFALWLDSRMVYSCAYFATPDEDLETAQERKLDYICRKLRLQPGERLLDIGCGWGALIMYAAQHYGVQADGITISTQQAELARERIKQAGLENSCHVDICDYRDLNRPARYDKAVSVGMAEHLGKAFLPIYFKKAWEVLRPGGIFLNQGINTHATARILLGRDFVYRYVYPDGEAVPIGTTVQIAESVGFQVRDVENVKEHYAHTMRHWLRRYEEHAEEAKKIVGELVYRSWRVYLAVALHEFEEVQTVHESQTILLKCENGRSGLPLMRKDWFIQSSQS